jgi:hypothetical protein
VASESALRLRVHLCQSHARKPCRDVPLRPNPVRLAASRGCGRFTRYLEWSSCMGPLGRVGCGVTHKRRDRVSATTEGVVHFLPVLLWVFDECAAVSLVRAPAWWEELETLRHALFGPASHCGDNGPRLFRHQNCLSRCTLLTPSIAIIHGHTLSRQVIKFQVSRVSCYIR